MNATTTEPKRPVEAGHDVLIKPTASARKELPPERYQITRGAAINMVSYHVACHNALLRAADAAKSNKSELKLLGEAEDELGIAERTIEELESLASDEDVDYVLGYLKRVHHWEPRDIRPKKMERTPRQKRAAHTLEKMPQEPQRGKQVGCTWTNQQLGGGIFVDVVLAPNSSACNLAYDIVRKEHESSKGIEGDELFLDNDDRNVPAPEPVPHWIPCPGHTGTTLPKDWKHPNGDFKGWQYYPVVQHFVPPTEIACVDRSHYAFIEVTQQDGCWVWGYDVRCNTGGSASALGRTGGEVSSKERAVLMAWWEVLRCIKGHMKHQGKGNNKAQQLWQLIEQHYEQLSAKALLPVEVDEPARYFHPDKNLPYIHTHKLEPWIWVGADGACWLFHAPLAPGWTVKDNEHLGPLLVAPKDLPGEAYDAQYRVPLALGKQPANGKVKMMVQRILDREALKRNATNAANVTNKTIGRKLKKKLGHQAGDVLPDGTMVADPTNAILELHDQVNHVPLKVEAVPPSKTIEELLPAAKWAPPVSASNLTELAKPFGADRRAREVVKKRFTSLYGKLAKMNAEERAAFLSYVNAHLQ